MKKHCNFQYMEMLCEVVEKIFFAMVKYAESVDFFFDERKILWWKFNNEWLLRRLTTFLFFQFFNIKYSLNERYYRDPFENCFGLFMVLHTHCISLDSTMSENDSYHRFLLILLFPLLMLLLLKFFVSVFKLLFCSISSWRWSTPRVVSTKCYFLTSTSLAYKRRNTGVIKSKLVDTKAL